MSYLPNPLCGALFYAVFSVRNEFKELSDELRDAIDRGSVEEVKDLLRIDELELGSFKILVSRILGRMKEEPQSENSFVETLKAILESGKPLDFASHRSMTTPLIQAVLSGNVDIFRLLVNHPQIDVNEVDGYTPLMIAVQDGMPHMVRELLATPEIDLYVRDEDGKTAMDMDGNLIT